jgi:hypothetical protein
MNELAEELEKVLQTDPLITSDIITLPSSEKGTLGLLEEEAVVAAKEAVVVVVAEEEVAISPKESIAADTSNNTQVTSETIDTSQETTSVSDATSDFTDFSNESINESMQELQALNSGELYFALAMGQATDSEKITEISNWQSVFGTGEDSAILYHNVHNG